MPLLLLALSVGIFSTFAEVSGIAPYRISSTVRAVRLTDSNFEHDTQASSGMTSGVWLVLFVPSNIDASPTRFSEYAVQTIRYFEAFTQLPPDMLDTYQVVSAVVECDNSPALCSRFTVAAHATKLVLLRAGKMYLLPMEEMQSVDAIERFISISRRIQGNDIPATPSSALQTQLIMLIGGIIGIVGVRYYIQRRLTVAPSLLRQTAVCRKQD